MNCYPDKDNSSSESSEGSSVNVNELIAYSEGSQTVNSSKASSFMSRIEKEKSEWKKCKMHNDATGFTVSSKRKGGEATVPKKKISKSLKVDASQPTMTEYVARMKSTTTTSPQPSSNIGSFQTHKTPLKTEDIDVAPVTKEKKETKKGTR